MNPMMMKKMEYTSKILRWLALIELEHGHMEGDVDQSEKGR